MNAVRTMLLACSAAALAQHTAHGAQFAVPRAAIAEDLRIDGVAEDLVPIDGVFIGPDGRIAITQSQDARVVVFDQRGKRLFNFGNRGQGPGAFMAIAGAYGGWRADTLWVWDPTTRRITSIGPAGALVRTVSLASAYIGPRATGMSGRRIGRLFPLGYEPGGSLIARAEVRAGAAEERFVVLVSPRGEIHRTIAALPEQTGSLRFDLGGGRAGATGIPFRANPYDLRSADGSLFGFVTTSDTASRGVLEVVVRSAANERMVERDYSYAGAPIPPAVIDSAVTAIIERLKKPGISIDASGAAPNRVPRMYAPGVLARAEAELRARMPRMRTPLRGAQLGIDHSIWIALAQSDSSIAHIALDERGTPVFSVVLPPHAKLAAASMTRLWAIVKDSDDVQSVVRYRVVR